MSKPTYYELLKHPLWQRKRLQILDRAKFRCESCGDEESTLHVHHGYYERGLKPWEYPDDSLHCLCESCHESDQELLTSVHRTIGRLASSWIESVAGYARAVESWSYPEVPFEIPSYEFAVGVADSYGLEPEQVIDALVDRQIDGFKLGAMREQKRRASRRPGENPA